MNLVAGGAVLLIGLIMGFVMTSMLSRGRTQLQIQAALAEEKATSSRVPLLETEMQKLTDRAKELESKLLETATAKASKEQHVSSLTEAVQRLEAEHTSLSRVNAESVRSLQETKERNAALDEQAARIPALEKNIQFLQQKLQDTEQGLREISTAEAQQRQRAESLLESRDRIQNEKAVVDEQYADASRQLQEANGHKAALEEQVARIQPLEQRLANVEKKYEETSSGLTQLKESSGRENGKLAAELEGARNLVSQAQSRLEVETKQREEAEGNLSKLSAVLAELRTQSDADRAHAEEKLQLLTDAKEMLGQQFKTLASDILEEKSKRFTEQNQTNIGQLLEPLKNRLKEFQGKVEEVYVQEGKDRTALAEQVKQLMALNQALSEDAKNLTTALKGSSKTRGNWGELVLERVLEASGLRKGEEYIVQDTQTREDGSRAQPDVVINLPEERKLIVDSKVSLIGYEGYVSAESEETKASALRQHMDSVRGHIKSLSDKNYQTLYGKSLDFVLAFIPIEPAFMLAITHDKDLFMEAWQRNVLLVSPSTLLFVVRTVAHLWRQEAQSRNAQEIAKRGADLYDKLCGFVGDIEDLGNRIKQAQAAYDKAHNKLSSGRGNVIRKAEELRDLGVKPTKALPETWVSRSLGEEDQILVRKALPNAAGDNSEVADVNIVETNLEAGESLTSDDI